MPTTGRAMIEAARQAVSTISSADLHAKLTAGETLVVLDIREQEEWNDGHIPQATFLARGRIEGRVEDIIPDKSTPIVTHWMGEARAALAGQTLQQLGYTNVCYLAGGFKEWRDTGLPVT